MPSDVKGDLFGRVVHRRTGKHIPEPESLHAPFAGPMEADFQSVAYRFCRGCGLIAEVNETIARRLAGEAGTPFDGPVPSGIYFETSGCAWCAGGETIGLVIKPLPPRPNDSCV